MFSKPEIILSGTKILSLKYKGVRIIDSLNFLPMPLSKFSKTFDIKEQSKGFFPHNFNIPINQNYVGLYPDKSFYQPEFFMNDQKEEFDKWYANQSNKLFDFKHELVKYCISDVKLLKEGC